ncbi:putative histidine kinase-like protein HHK3p [Periconia macrospinosa]|uniref:Putative histidine kinase-like protein HHK3p n=1 Tax=Periconia macrospinosa TaxID=97972 RepID=A0A2V1DYZ6_9PLEO|nr:putative histidine kinase-like protein HHK3p [Periconia macrospinosa]
MSEKCNGSQRRRFFPRADAAVLQSKYTPPSPTSRPSTVAPIFDTEHADHPLCAWSQNVAACVYPETTDIWAPAVIPQRPEHVTSSYLFPILTRNERLRLTMLSYYTRGLLEDSELVSRLQEKVHLAKETIEWEFVIAGLLDHNTFTRIATVGLPLAVLPRRESTCAHTVNQPPGVVFTLTNMAEDWRFQTSPHVEHGGLRAYAGVPLRFETEFGEHVCFGSLCVASNEKQEPLSRSQQTALVRLADWVVTDIVHSARARRQRERRRMQELLNNANELCQRMENVEEIVLDVLKEIYPEVTISIQKSDDRRLVTLDGRNAIPYSDFDNGLWEDVDCFDEIIQDGNHSSMVSTQHVRVIAAECDQSVQPTYLVIASKDFRLVFDDVDFWLVNSCAALLSRFWQKRALNEALTIKENFLRGIAHQLRTPIHGILGSADLLAEDLKAREILELPSSADSSSGFSEAETPNLYSYISAIRNSARELVGTVNSMIKINQWADAARSDHVGQLYHVEELETTLLNEMISIIPDDYNRRPSIILSRRLPSECDSLVVDLKLMIDCLSPLVINAIQNTVGGGVVAVTTSLSEDYQSLIVDVEDTGCGIALHNQKHIFDAHRKLDEHSTRAGLGLTLSSRLATLMDGSVALISSTEGKGSHFRASFHVTWACSRKPPRSIRERLKHLPSTFYKLPSTTPSSPLDQHICSFLTDLGVLQSECSSTPLVIINYSADVNQFRKGLPRISPNQVAICLIPDFAESHNMSEERVKSENNIVFVKGPFLPRVIEEALNQAHLIFSNLNSENGNHVNEHLESVSVQLKNTTIARSTISTSVVEPSPIKEIAVTTTQDILIETVLTAPPTPPPARATRPMALLVDDNAVNLRLLQMYCKRRKIPCCTATDGEKAVNTFLKYQSASSRPAGAEPIELILMDLQMPVCNGLDATRQIRTLEKEHGWASSVISIVTGQDSPSDRLGAIDAGTQGFLTKPVGPKVLDNKIKQWFPGLDLEDGV